MPTHNLTPSQVCKLLNCSSSTLRRWSGAFAVHLSQTANPKPGHKRTYSAADLAQLQRAADLMRAGKSPEEAAALLNVVAPPEQLTGAELVTVPALAAQLATAGEAMRRLGADLDAARKEQEAQRAQLDEQGRQLAELTRRLQAWESMPWWARMIGRKPKG